MEFKAAEYQTLIAKHIADNPRCAIWASMGMGKTSSTLTALVQLDLMEDVYPALVLAPLRVAKNTWPAEVRKWDHTKHLRVSPIVGTVDERRNACARKADVYTTNYDNLVWLVEYYGDRWPFKTVIADEGTRLKSYRTKQGGVRTQALGTIAFTKIKRFVELTGTPAPNGLKDLWGQLWFVDGGLRLGRTYSAFMSRWFGRDYTGYGVTAFKHAQDEIQMKLKDVCLTVDAKDYFDLEDPIVKTVPFMLPVRARNLYEEMEKELFMMVEEHEVEAFNAAAKTQKLLQLCSGAVYVDPLVETDSDKRSKEWKLVHDEKLVVLESIVEEAAGMPVLVAYHFKSDLARLLKRFPQGRALDTNPKTEDEWNAGKIPVLFAHPASAGHGLNLQFGGNILVYFSHDWNLENRLQILERIGPMRQLQAKLDRPVFVYMIVAENSVEELVIARVDDKREVQDLLLNYMKRKPGRPVRFARNTLS